jgi:hypothetical protein
MGNDSVEEIPYIRIVKETGLAWLVLFNDDNPICPQQEWLPKSQCEIDEDEETISIPEWLCLEKDLI